MSERVKVSSKTPESKRGNSVSQTRKTDFSQSTNSPIDHILSLQRTIGNQAVQRLFKSGSVQAKLKIGQPGDIYEQEADRVADAVIRMPEPRLHRQAEEKEEEEELIQTKPLAEQITPLVQRQMEEEEEEILQAKESLGQTQEATPDLESCIHALKGGGCPLPESVRSFFEPRFGYNFNQVQLHTDARAAEIARAVNARAFTVGRNIVLGSGQYRQATVDGRHLIAHELTHVVQQDQNNNPKIQRQKREEKSKGGYKFHIHSKTPDESSTTGHAFISIEDPEGDKQFYGFYPICVFIECTGLWLFGTPGIVKDDRGHLYNAKLTYQITEDQYRQLKDFVDEIKREKPIWSVWFNCADFVIEAALAIGLKPPSTGWFVNTPGELLVSIYSGSVSNYRECLLRELERPGGMPSEKEIIEAGKECSTEIGPGFAVPNISEEEAYEFLEEVQEGNLSLTPSVIIS